MHVAAYQIRMSVQLRSVLVLSTIPNIISPASLHSVLMCALSKVFVMCPCALRLKGRCEARFDTVLDLLKDF
jgi:hypothetical protein